MHVFNLLLFGGLDRTVLTFLNGSGSLFLDQAVLAFTHGVTWIPLYLALFYMVIRNNETMPQVMLTVAAAACCVLLAGGLDDLIVKPLVQSYRPSRDPQWADRVDIALGYRGRGLYGFFSAHAANTMAVAVFVALLVRSRMLSVTMVLWSLTSAWTRLYLGVHYPSDVLVGLLWGAAAGTAVWLLYRRLYRRLSPNLHYLSSQYTSTGYDCKDIDTVMTVAAMTLAYVLIRGVM